MKEIFFQEKDISLQIDVSAKQFESQLERIEKPRA
jgi:hypothetical protein